MGHLVHICEYGSDLNILNINIKCCMRVCVSVCCWCSGSIFLASLPLFLFLHLFLSVPGEQQAVFSERSSLNNMSDYVFSIWPIPPKVLALCAFTFFTQNSSRSLRIKVNLRLSTKFKSACFKVQRSVKASFHFRVKSTTHNCEISPILWEIDLIVKNRFWEIDAILINRRKKKYKLWEIYYKLC